MPNERQEQVGRALGRIPSGCAILTARHDGRRTGMLASWVQQAGFEPPMVSVAVNRQRPIARLIEASGGFVLNLLGENPTAMFKHFARGFSLDEDAFEGINAREVTGGIEIPDRVARLSAVVRGKTEAGDHDLYVGEVVEAEVGEPSGRPYVHIRKTGFSY